MTAPGSAVILAVLATTSKSIQQPAKGNAGRASAMPRVRLTMTHTQPPPVAGCWPNSTISEPVVLLSRRRTLIGGAAVLLGMGALFRLPSGQAAPDPTSAAASAAENDFLAFSRAITGHAELEPETARRIYAAMAAATGFAAQAARLTGLVTAGQEPRVLLAGATAAGLRDTALAVVAAWYTGTVSSESRTTVVSYAQALMYQPVRDGQSPPTYCNAGPAWWTRDPPPIRVSAPVEKAAPAAPTTGTPMPVNGSPAPPPTTPPMPPTPSASPSTSPSR
ncbi:MAG: D-sorbitol dehydrogenase [Rhodoferax sp.]|nr:D-sorbitol dehydrogenase [Rhodoferax sp.]